MTQFSNPARSNAARVAVAKAQLGPFVFLILFFLPIVGFALSASAFAVQLVAIAGLVLSGVAAVRAAKMGLFLTPEAVEVVNFFGEHSFDRETVKIELVDEASSWPADDIPAAMKESSGNETPAISMLYLSDASGQRARVQVAPSYGSRTTRIVRDLWVALDS